MKRTLSSVMVELLAHNQVCAGSSPAGSMRADGLAWSIILALGASDSGSNPDLPTCGDVQEQNLEGAAEDGIGSLSRICTSSPQDGTNKKGRLASFTVVVCCRWLTPHPLNSGEGECVFSTVPIPLGHIAQRIEHLASNGDARSRSSGIRAGWTGISRSNQNVGGSNPSVSVEV